MQKVNESCSKEETRDYYRLITPYLTDDELLARYRRIKPIVFSKQNYHYLKKCNIEELRRIFFLHELEQKIGIIANMEDARTISEFPCYWLTNRSISVFNPIDMPPIATVLQQFPDELLNEANAFYVAPERNLDFDANRQQEIEETYYHQSTVKALVMKK